jgi:hypothetical protein
MIVFAVALALLAVFVLVAVYAASAAEAPKAPPADPAPPPPGLLDPPLGPLGPPAPPAPPGLLAPAGAPAPDTPGGAWNLDDSERYVGACGEYVPGAFDAGVVPTPNTVYNSMYRVCNRDDAQNAACAHFPSRFLKHAMCAVTPPQAYPTYASKGDRYGQHVPNNNKRPGCATWITLPDESEARRACDAQPKCTGYYRGATFALAIAPPGKCVVDWKPLTNAEPDACARLLGAGFETHEGTDYSYCRPKCGTTHNGPNCPRAHCAAGFTPYGEACMPDAAHCPAGWTSGAQCLPPCASGARTDEGWCKPVGGECVEGYQRLWMDVWGRKFDLCVPSVTRITGIEGQK